MCATCNIPMASETLQSLRYMDRDMDPRPVRLSNHSVTKTELVGEVPKIPMVCIDVKCSQLRIVAFYDNL